VCHSRVLAIGLLLSCVLLCVACAAEEPGTDPEALTTDLEYLAAAVNEDWDQMKAYLPDEFLDPELDREVVLRNVKSPICAVPLSPDELLNEENWTLEAFQGQTRLRYLSGQPGVVLWMKKDHGRWLVNPGFDRLMWIKVLSEGTAGMGPGGMRTIDHSSVPIKEALHICRDRLGSGEALAREGVVRVGFVRVAVKRIGSGEALVRWDFQFQGEAEVAMDSFRWTVGDGPVTSELIRSNAILDGDVLRIPPWKVEDKLMSGMLTVTFHLTGLPPGKTDAVFEVTDLQIGEVLISHATEFTLENYPQAK